VNVEVVWCDGIFGADGRGVEMSGLSASLRASSPADWLLALAVSRLRGRQGPDCLGRVSVAISVVAVVSGRRRTSHVVDERPR